MKDKDEKTKEGSCPNIDSIAGVQLALAWAARRVVQRKLQTQTGRTFAYMLSVLLDAYKQDGSKEVDANLARIERVLGLIGEKVVQDPGKGVGTSASQGVPGESGKISDSSRGAEKLQDGDRKEEDNQ